jgi:hypothetical protein
MWIRLRNMALRALMLLTSIGSSDEPPRRYSMGTRAGRWDAFVDAVGRLPRPIMIFMAIGFFVWSVAWSRGDFVVWAEAMAKVPDPVWYTISIIIGVVWGSKKFAEDYATAKGINVHRPSGDVVDPMADVPPPPPGGAG